MTNITSITVQAKRWFQASYGNTYHSVVVTNDDTGEELSAPFAYGYDNMYQKTALDLMVNAGWIDNPGRTTYPLRRLLENDLGINLNDNVEEVKRKRDL